MEGSRKGINGSGISDGLAKKAYKLMVDVRTQLLRRLHMNYVKLMDSFCVHIFDTPGRLEAHGVLSGQ